MIDKVMNCLIWFVVVLDIVWVVLFCCYMLLGWRKEF